VDERRTRSGPAPGGGHAADPTDCSEPVQRRPRAWGGLSWAWRSADHALLAWMRDAGDGSPGVAAAGRRGRRRRGRRGRAGGAARRRRDPNGLPDARTVVRRGGPLNAFTAVELASLVRYRAASSVEVTKASARSRPRWACVSCTARRPTTRPASASARSSTPPRSRCHSTQSGWERHAAGLTRRLDPVRLRGRGPYARIARRPMRAAVMTAVGSTRRCPRSGRVRSCSPAGPLRG
jgi:hypothetical protein